MTKYLSPDEIPGKRSKWPYHEWVKDIPEGKLLEITDQLNGRSIRRVRGAISTYCRNHNLPLVPEARTDRLFIFRKVEVPA